MAGLAYPGSGVSGEGYRCLTVAVESDGIRLCPCGLDKLADGSHHAAHLTFRRVLFTMLRVLVLEEFELLEVADAVVAVGGTHCLIDSLFLGAESVADFGESCLRDSVVEMSDLTVGILSDLIALS